MAIPSQLREGVLFLVVLAASTFVGGVLVIYAGGRFMDFPKEMLEAVRPGSLPYVLLYATPLIITSLAVAVAAAGGMLNIGVEGQLYLGALAAGLIGHDYLGWFGENLWLQGGVAYTVSLLLPGAVCAAAVILKKKFGAHEVLTTLFSYFLVLALANWVVSLPDVRDPRGIPQTRGVALGLRLPILHEDSALSIAIILAILLAGVVHLVIRRSHLGLRLRAIGSDTAASRRVGIPVETIQFAAMFVSGALAAFCGLQRVMGQDGRFDLGFSPGYGFIGIGIAFAADLRPAQIVVVSLIFGWFQQVGVGLDQMGVPKEVVSALQATSLILILALRKTIGKVNP